MNAQVETRGFKGIAWMLKTCLVLLALGPGLAGAQTLTVLTHDSFNISEEVIRDFEAETGIELRFLEGGDAGETVNRAILTMRRPLADVLYGIDNNLIARAAAVGLFEPYRSPLLERVPADLRFSPEHLVTPIDVGYVNFNLDKAFFEEAGLEPPQDLDDLVAPRYRGLTAVMNPATSSPGLAFMLATIARYGDDWLDYWAALRDNEVLVTDGWTEAYYTAFSRYGGDRPIVLSYATSPAAEVIFSEEDLEEAPTANLFCDRCVYRQIEAVGILKGTKELAAARTFIDYMLSRRFQEDIPMNMFVYPVVTTAKVPGAFERFSQQPEAEEVAALPPETIERNLRGWLRDWTRVVEQNRAP